MPWMESTHQRIPSLSLSSSSSSSFREPLSSPLHHMTEEADSEKEMNSCTTIFVRKSWCWRRPYFSYLSDKNKCIVLISAVLVASVFTTVLITVSATNRRRHRNSSSLYFTNNNQKPIKSVAFIGNSLMYYYDLPRSAQIVSDGTIRQSSVLAGAGSLANMQERQNGMWNRWRTDTAIISNKTNDDDEADDDYDADDDEVVWDFGACTMEMLLFGHNAKEAQANHDHWKAYQNRYEGGDDDNSDDDDDDNDDDDGWEFDSRSISNYRNFDPCTQSQAYLDYLNDLPDWDMRRSPPEQWDFVVLNDRSKGPTSEKSRHAGLSALAAIYLPLLQQSQATAAFLVTPAYWTDRDNDDDDGNSNGFAQVPYWTVQTYEGYKQYAHYLANVLPASQKPQLINVGIAFLTVYEEDPDLWLSLFWTDNKHQSPHGSFLQSCLLHYVVFEELPRRSTVIRTNMTTLWDGTRTLMHPRDTVVPFPTTDEAEYLYDVCARVATGYVPQVFQEQLDANGLSLYE